MLCFHDNFNYSFRQCCLYFFYIYNCLNVHWNKLLMYITWRLQTVLALVVIFVWLLLPSDLSVVLSWSEIIWNEVKLYSNIYGNSVSVSEQIDAIFISIKNSRQQHRMHYQCSSVSGHHYICKFKSKGAYLQK